MLKKLGLVTVGVTAGLMAVAPLASANESHPASDDCNVSSDGNNIGVERCNTTGQHNGEGNVLNGTELPTIPVPDAPDAAGIAGIVNGAIPDLSNVPVQI